MNVLVVDDDRSTRFLLTRTLTRRFGCDVAEACDGDQALDALARGAFQLAMLDVRMPGIDGLQTLRIMREDPAFASLPVVMLTGERDEAVVREILSLGVLEYMTKPLNVPRLAERLKRILRCVGSDRGGAPARSESLARALRDDSRPALIIEGRSAFRRFFCEALALRRPVLQAESGVRGIRDCVEADPAMVFIGSDLGVLAEPLVARKIRSLPAIAHLPLVGLVDNDEEADQRVLTYDGTLRRTFDRAELLDQMAALSRRDNAAALEALGLRGGFRAAVVLVGEDVFGSTLSADVGLRDLPSPSNVERIFVGAAATVAGSARVHFRIACDTGTARRAATNLFGIDSRIVRAADLDAAAARVFELVCARLQDSLADSGQPLAFDAATSVHSAEVLPSPAMLDAGLVFHFRSLSSDQSFWLTIRPDEGGEAGTAGPDGTTDL